MRDPMINAFAVPNGSIYLHTGLLALIENEHQLSSVMLHEIGHVKHRKTFQFNRSNRKKSVAFHVLMGVSSAAPIAGTWGDEVAMVPNAASLDALVFTHVNGQMLTGGKKAFGWLVAGPKSSASAGDLCLVDAKTGDVLALEQLYISGDVYKEPDKSLHKATFKALKKIGVDQINSPAPQVLRVAGLFR